MTPVLVVLALFAAASAASAFLQSQRRDGEGIISGSEFLLIGVALGPLGLDFLSRGLLAQVAPASVLGLALLGLAQGMRAGQRHWWKEAREILPLAVVLVGLAFALLLAMGFDWRTALLFSAFALSGSRAVANPYSRRVGIIAVLMALAVWQGRAGVSAAALGTGLGAFAAWLTAGAWQVEFAWLAILGSIALLCGAGLRFALLPLSSSLFAGLTLSLSSRHRGAIAELLRPTERPALQVMLLLLGASLGDAHWSLVSMLVAAPLLASTVASAVHRRWNEAPRLWPAGALTVLVGLSLDNPTLRAACAAQLVVGDVLWFALGRRGETADVV